MIVTTAETIAQKKIVKTLGLVRANTIRARHIGRDIAAVSATSSAVKSRNTPS